MAWVNKINSAQYKVLLCPILSDSGEIREMGCSIIPRETTDLENAVKKNRCLVKIRSRGERDRSEYEVKRDVDSAMDHLIKYFVKNAITGESDILFIIYNREEFLKFAPGFWARSSNVSVLDMYGEEFVALPNRAKEGLEYLATVTVNALRKQEVELSKTAGEKFALERMKWAEEREQHALEGMELAEERRRQAEEELQKFRAELSEVIEEIADRKILLKNKDLEIAELKEGKHILENVRADIDQLNKQRQALAEQHSELLRKNTIQELIFSKVQKKIDQENLNLVELQGQILRERKNKRPSIPFQGNRRSQAFQGTRRSEANPQGIGGSLMDLRPNSPFARKDSGDSTSMISKFTASFGMKNRKQSDASSSSRHNLSYSTLSLLKNLSRIDMSHYDEEIKYTFGAGYCLVISYGVNRPGNDDDENKITDFCHEFNLTQNKCKNMSKLNVTSKIREVQTVFNTADCPYEYLLVFIMAHGGVCPDTGREFIAAKYQEDQQEGEPIYIQHEIVAQFNSDSCQGLHDKPKIFIVQACRGHQANALSKTVIDLASTKTSLNRDAAPTNAIPSHQIVQPPPEDWIPSVIDTLVWKSAVENCYSTRIAAKGSWFVQNVVEVFCQDPTQSLAKSIKVVNRRAAKKTVTTRDHHQTEENTFPVPCVAHNTLRTDFYFCNPQERRESH